MQCLKLGTYTVPLVYEMRKLLHEELADLRMLVQHCVMQQGSSCQVLTCREARHSQNCKQVSHFRCKCNFLRVAVTRGIPLVVEPELQTQISDVKLEFRATTSRGLCARLIFGPCSAFLSGFGAIFQFSHLFAVKLFQAQHKQRDLKLRRLTPGAALLSGQFGDGQQIPGSGGFVQHVDFMLQ